MKRETYGLDPQTLQDALMYLVDIGVMPDNPTVDDLLRSIDRMENASDNVKKAFIQEYANSYKKSC